MKSTICILLAAQELTYAVNLNVDDNQLSSELAQVEMFSLGSTTSSLTSNPEPLTTSESDAGQEQLTFGEI